MKAVAASSLGTLCWGGHLPSFHPKQHDNNRGGRGAILRQTHLDNPSETSMAGDWVGQEREVGRYRSSIDRFVTRLGKFFASISSTITVNGRLHKTKSQVSIASSQSQSWWLFITCTPTTNSSRITSSSTNSNDRMCICTPYRCLFHSSVIPTENVFGIGCGSC